MGNSEGHKGEEPPVYSPYLNIRYDLADMGGRPLAPGVVFWASPDILVSPTDALGNVEAGTQVTVQARVANWGLAPAIATKVSFYWADPSLGIVPANGQLIGSKLVTVPSNNYMTVTCPTPWQPQFVNGGHECLIVECTCPQDPIDPAKSFRPDLERHVGQRNITVTSGQQAQPMQLVLGNPFDEPQAFTLHVSGLRVFGLQEALSGWSVQEKTAYLANLASANRRAAPMEQKLHLRTEPLKEQARAVQLVGIQPNEVRQVDEAAHPQSLRAFLHERLRRNPDFRPESLGRPLGEITLEPGQTARADLVIQEARMRPDEARVLRFTQVVSGCDVGGYSVVIGLASQG